MKKNLLLIGYILFLAARGYCQFVEPTRLPDLDCHVNVNARADEDFRNDIKRAVLKLRIPSFGNCSATLINRNTTQDQLGQYFITAWHCFKSGDNCGGDEFNFNNEVTLTFNYQSPNDQSLVFQPNSGGDVYSITRKIRLVDRFVCSMGDFALCEILGAPIPPHFNVYYAGWYPTESFMNANKEFALIHHPGGTIKKISATDNVINGDIGGVKTTCLTVTKVIDFLIGWIWKRRFSTSVVCTYLQLPFIGPKWEVIDFKFGKEEKGSSGSGFFTGQSGFAGANRLMGQLSAGSPAHHCVGDVGISYFGKFSDNYVRQATKNTLNPENDYWVDQEGKEGRQISCYPQINLTAESASGWDLYPANTYQQQNDITLTSQSTFVTTNKITIKNGANFTFQAGQTIELNPDFEVESGATFVAEITPSPCTIKDGVAWRSTSLAGVTPEFQKLLKNFPALNQKKFDINKYLPAEVTKKGNNVTNFNLYPNPSKGNINIELFLKEQEKNVLVDIYDLYGRHIYSKKYSNIYFIKESLSLPSLNNGMYNMIIRTDYDIFSKKIIISR